MVDIIVRCEPSYVEFECSKCEHENEINYSDFVSDNGEPPDWLYVRCGECGYEERIDMIDWD